MNRHFSFSKLITLALLLSTVLSACSPNLRASTGEPEARTVSTESAEPIPTRLVESVPDNGNQDGPPSIEFTATGDIQAEVQEFRTLLGSNNEGEPGGKASGRREVDWEGVPGELAAPKNYRGDFFNASSAPRARGLVMSIPGNKFMVSATRADASGTPGLFGNLNPSYPDSFKAFSGERIFTPIDSNLFEIGFYVPGTETAAAVRAFGAVFADVDGSDSFLEFFDPGGKSLGRYRVPAADNELSFLGIVYEEPIIARVRVKLGNTPIGLEDGDGIDVVVMDDIIYSEPQTVEGVVAGVAEPPKAAAASRETQAITETVTITATETPAAVAAPDEFLLNFDDAGDKRLASVTLDLSGLSPAPDGKTYVVWLIDYNRNYLMLDEALPGQMFIYTDPSGNNLISRYRGAVLSLEDSDAVQAKTLKEPTEVYYQGEIASEILPLLQKLVVAASDTPGKIPYGYGLREEAIIAEHHAGVLVESLQGNDLAAAQMHMEHLWNTLVGFHSSEYGDMNGDGKAENYGDGFGFLLYASRVVSILDEIAELRGINDHLREGAVNAAKCTRSIANKLGPEVIAKGRTIFAAQEAAPVVSDAEVVFSAVETMAVGFDTNGNGSIDAVEGECGATQVYELTRKLYHIHMFHDDAGHTH